MNKAVLLGGLIATVPLLWVFNNGFGKDPHAIASPLVGKTAPEFALREVDSQAIIGLQDGRPTVVNFFATWCRPCIAEHHILAAGAKRWGDRSRFLGVVYEDTDANIRKFLKRSGKAYPTLVDEGGRTAIAYGVYGVPETFFVSPSGSITHKHAGPISLAKLNRGIAAAARAK